MFEYIFLSILLLFIGCQINKIKPKQLKYELIKISLDESQRLLNSVVIGLPLSAENKEKINGIPDNINDISFISIKISQAVDSIITGLRAFNSDGEEIYYFDTNNDEDFTNESPLRMTTIEEKTALEVKVQFDDLIKEKEISREIILELLKEDNRIKYHIKNYWKTEIYINDDSLCIASIRFPPTYAIVFIDPNKNGIYDKPFDTSSERIALGDKFYNIHVDIPAEEIKLV